MSDSCHLPAVLADVIAGGPERWNALSEGKTSDQLVDVLLEDLGALMLREKDTFVPLVWPSHLLDPVGFSPSDMIESPTLFSSSLMADRCMYLWIYQLKSSPLPSNHRGTCMYPTHRESSSCGDGAKWKKNALIPLLLCATAPIQIFLPLLQQLFDLERESSSQIFKCHIIVWLLLFLILAGG